MTNFTKFARNLAGVSTQLGRLLLLMAIFLSIATTVVAESCEDKECKENEDNPNEYTQCLVEKKSCLEQKLAEAQSQKVTLSNTIAILQGKINVQQLQIQQTQAEIARLEKDIADLTERIGGLNLSLDRLTSMLVERVRAQYKEMRTSPFTVLASTESFNKVVAREEYVNVAGAQTALAMQRAEMQRLVYDQQKALKETKQAEVEAKRAQLEKEKQVLAVQRQEQQSLLDVTNSNERKCQQLIEEARKELAQIQSAASIVIREGNEVEIKRGESVGTMGNSGFSTGAHLHFGVYKYSVKEFQSIGEWGWYYSNYINPLDKLKSFSVLWDTGCGNDLSGQQNAGSGDWDWPMKGIRITQSYGSNTCYNYFYGGKPHPALDLVAIGDPTVYAVDDGKGYFCRNCLGDGGNGVFIFHDDGYMSLYWHLK